MIFVTLGTQKFQLNRLLMLLDDYVDSGAIKDEIFAQIGGSDYKPRNFRCAELLKKDEFEACIERADVVISHVGVGAVMNALNRGKPVIMFPRLAKHSEHVDNHQTEVATAFAEKNYALLCTEEDNLAELVEKARTHTFNKYISQTKNIVNLIEDFIGSQNN